MALSVVDWLLLLLFLGLLSLGLAMWKNGHFTRRGASHHGAPLPFLGNMRDIFLAREHFVERLLKVYNSARGQRYTGFFAFTEPVMVIRDLDLIKKVGVKDFDHFVDHKVFMDEEAEPLFGANLFFLRGQKWREMRAALSPAFTSSKMKSMFPLVEECSIQIKDFLLKESKQHTDNDIMEIEIKETFTRYTNDVIASTAFGFKINSFENKTNEFYMMGKKATNFSGWQFLKFQGYATFPKLMKMLKLPLFSHDVAFFFRNLVKSAMVDREEHGIIRHDMIHLLMQAKKGKLLQDEADLAQLEDARFSTVQSSVVLKQEAAKREWSQDDLTAQAVAFIVAGFGTPSSMLVFTCYELARNPHVQRKLHQEIDDVMTRTAGRPSFADLNSMKYIDMVISEILRLWPPDGFLERTCVKAYTLPPQNEHSKTEFTMKVNETLIIPIYSIHHDPHYFPNPEKFDPERFSDENKASIKPFTYIPFGIGPRLCIGARFALMEAKAVLFHVLAHFELVITEKTTIPFVLAKDTFNMHPESGLYLGLRQRKTKTG